MTQWVHHSYDDRDTPGMHVESPSDSLASGGQAPRVSVMRTVACGYAFA